jgi:hypothetical protein
MKQILIATAALSLMCGCAYAQGTGPAPQQDNMTKPATTNNSMEKGSPNKGTMSNGTTGMNNSGMAKDPNAMPNQDATSQGTVGPGSMKK